MDVWLAGRRHLETLDARSSRRGIEDDDLCAVNAGKALHRGRTSVAARRREDEDATAASGIAHEDGEHRKRDVLECASLAVEKFEHVKPVLLD